AQLAPQGRAHATKSSWSPGLGHDGRHDELAAHGIGHADHGGELDLRERLERDLHLARRHGRSRGRDHAADPALEEQVALRIEPAAVARVVEAVGVERLLALALVQPLTAVVAAHADLAVVAPA